MLDSNCPTSSRLTPNDRVLFLDFDGVLHPDDVYRTPEWFGIACPGQLMMHAGILVEILEDFPQVKISLSTSWVRILGYRRARAALPPELQAHREQYMALKDARAPFEGYDMHSRYQQIRAAVTRAGLKNWLALDDDPFASWPDHDRRLIRTDPDLGLSSVLTQEELRFKLRALMRM